MKHNGKKVKFSVFALKMTFEARKSLDYIEALIERDLVDSDIQRECFIQACDNIEACIEHLKSEVINND